VRRLVIWYRRNAAVTSLVGTAATSASAAGTAAGQVAGSVGSMAGTVVSNAGTMAGSMLQPLVFDPLRRLQAGSGTDDAVIEDSARLWAATDDGLFRSP